MLSYSILIRSSIFCQFLGKLKRFWTLIVDRVSFMHIGPIQSDVLDTSEHLSDFAKAFLLHELLIYCSHIPRQDRLRSIRFVRVTSARLFTPSVFNPLTQYFCDVGMRWAILVTNDARDFPKRFTVLLMLRLDCFVAAHVARVVGKVRKFEHWKISIPSCY